MDNSAPQKSPGSRSPVGCAAAPDCIRADSCGFKAGRRRAYHSDVHQGTEVRVTGWARDRRRRLARLARLSNGAKASQHCRDAVSSVAQVERLACRHRRHKSLLAFFLP